MMENLNVQYKDVTSLRNTPIIVVFATNVPDVEFRHERLAPESPIISDGVIAVTVVIIFSSG
jgi:hypothetical protein